MFQSMQALTRAYLSSRHFPIISSTFSACIFLSCSDQMLLHNADHYQYEYFISMTKCPTRKCIAIIRFLRWWFPCFHTFIIYLFLFFIEKCKCEYCLNCLLCWVFIVYVFKQDILRKEYPYNCFAMTTYQLLLMALS